VNAAENPWVTATALGNDFDLSLAATAFGDLWYLELRPSESTLLVGDGVYSDRAIKLTSSEEPATVNLQAYSVEYEPRLGSTPILMQAMALLQNHEVVHELSRYGIALRDRTNPLPLPVVRGGKWQTRTTADVAFTMRRNIVEEVGLIETAQAAITIEPRNGEQLFTTNIDAQAP
jgi:hypothetical protein